MKSAVTLADWNSLPAFSLNRKSIVREPTVSGAGRARRGWCSRSSRSIHAVSLVLTSRNGSLGLRHVVPAGRSHTPSGDLDVLVHVEDRVVLATAMSNVKPSIVPAS